MDESNERDNDMSNATTTLRITNDEIAREYLSTIGRLEGLPINEETGKVVFPNPCGRCGGSGYGGWYQDGGVCYDCRGANTKGRTISYTLKGYAQKVKRERRAAEKKAEERRQRAEEAVERQRNWCEDNGHGRITFDELNAKRAQEREAALGLSQHVGELKQRLDLTLTLVACPAWDGYAYGTTTYCHIFVDADGNKVVWKTNDRLYSDAGMVELGTEVTLKATITEHGERDGEKQTRITRAKLVA